MDLADLRNNTRQLDVDFGDSEVLHLTYRPNLITPAWMSEPRSYTESIVQIVSDWDLTDGGEPVAITAEAIAEHVPMELQFVIVQEILEDLNPKARARRSGAGSSQHSIA